MNKRILVSVVFLFFTIFFSGLVAQEIENNELDKIPEEYKATITGRLLWEYKYPGQESAIVWLYEVFIEEDGNLRIITKFGKGHQAGKLLNPRSETDNTGKFTIVADRRFWEESGQFMLCVELMGRELCLENSKGMPRIFEGSPIELSLGDVLVKP